MFMVEDLMKKKKLVNADVQSDFAGAQQVSKTFPRSMRAYE
jgi:hypothetical protein